MFRGLIREPETIINYSRLMMLLMSKDLIRTQIHQYVDQIDTEFLDTLKQILENRLRSEDEFQELSDEDIAIINERKARIASGEDKLINASDAIQLLRNKKIKPK